MLAVFDENEAPIGRPAGKKSKGLAKRGLSMKKSRGLASRKPSALRPKRRALGDISNTRAKENALGGKPSFRLVMEKKKSKAREEMVEEVEHAFRTNEADLEFDGGLDMDAVLAASLQPPKLMKLPSEPDVDEFFADDFLDATPASPTLKALPAGFDDDDLELLL
eukprot:PLAT13114.2.p2 GENE.PLAT13114.2~~PLAT13114.2.p2  ORF type:complete len:165 (-),score=56.99 PLAT13114.2:149-643(-)